MVEAYVVLCMRVFTFRNPFPPPGDVTELTASGSHDACPAT
jgi:hypothetical protein